MSFKKSGKSVSLGVVKINEEAPKVLPTEESQPKEAVKVDAGKKDNQ